MAFLSMSIVKPAPGGFVAGGRPDPVEAVGALVVGTVEVGGRGTGAVFVGGGGVVATGGNVGGRVGCTMGVCVEGRLQADKARTSPSRIQKSLRFMLLLRKIEK